MNPAFGNPGAPVIDHEVISELKSLGSGTLLERVLGLFVTKVPEALGDIAKLSVQADRRAFADAVHGLKSMCLNIGARRAAAACDELEALARGNGEFDPISGTARIAREAAEAIREISLLRAA